MHLVVFFFFLATYLLFTVFFLFIMVFLPPNLGLFNLFFFIILFLDFLFVAVIFLPLPVIIFLAVFFTLSSPRLFKLDFGDSPDTISDKKLLPNSNKFGPIYFLKIGTAILLNHPEPRTYADPGLKTDMSSSILPPCNNESSLNNDLKTDASTGT